MAKKITTKKAVIKSAAKKTTKGKVSASEDKKKKNPAVKVPKPVVKKTAAEKKPEKKLTDKKKTTVKDKDLKIPMTKKKEQIIVKTSLGKDVALTPPVSAEQHKTKSVAHIKGYSKRDLEHFKKIILDKRDEIIEQLQNLKEQMLDPTTGEYINENSPYSLHMAEQGTDAMEREKTFLYAQRENKFLGYLEDALKRIESGTYGICVECIDEPQHLCETCPLIPKARLEAVPHSQLCLPIKQRQEKK